MDKTYYRKPIPVQAGQWPKDIRELEKFLDDNPRIKSIQITTAPPVERGDLRLPDPGEVTIELYGGDRLYLSDSDWIVCHKGDLFTYTDEAFKREYFCVETQPAVVVAPRLEDLL